MEKKTAWNRFLVVVSLMNVCPIIWLVFLYYFVIPSGSEKYVFIAAAVTSLSVFGFQRILHAFIATKTTWQRYYTQPGYAEMLEKWRGKDIGKTNTFIAHFVPGLLYLSVPVFLAVLIYFLGGEYCKDQLGIVIAVPLAITIIAMVVWIFTKYKRRKHMLTGGFVLLFIGIALLVTRKTPGLPSQFIVLVAVSMAIGIALITSFFVHRGIKGK